MDKYFSSNHSRKNFINIIKTMYCCDINEELTFLDSKTGFKWKVFPWHIVGENNKILDIEDFADDNEILESYFFEIKDGEETIKE